MLANLPNINSERVDELDSWYNRSSLLLLPIFSVEYIRTLQIQTAGLIVVRNLPRWEFVIRSSWEVLDVNSHVALARAASTASARSF